MRWVLPGGAEVGGDSEGAERRVVCRPQTGVAVGRCGVSAGAAVGLIQDGTSFPSRLPDSPSSEAVVDQPPRNSPTEIAGPTPAEILPGVTGPDKGAEVGVTGPTSDSTRTTFMERLGTAKLLIEVLVGLVGLIGAVLALVGVSRK